MKSMEQPVYIRGRKIENRIGFAPMGSSVYSDDCKMTDSSVELYRAIARGGAGLLIQGCAIVAEDARSHMNQLGIWSDDYIDGLKRLTEAVHGEGKVVIAQLQHGGLRSFLDEPLGPSEFVIPLKDAKKTGRAMTVKEIRTSQKQYVDAALRAVKAGYDGVELHASHGWLISSFLSRITNRREDEYGINKVLYLREVFQNIRRSVPDGFIVGVRISGYVPDLETGLEQAKEIAAFGVDYISVSVNHKVKWLEQEDTVSDRYPFNSMIYAAHEIKKIVPVPVFAAKGIRTGKMASDILAYTDVDMLLVGRGHLCDTQWAQKALSGKEPNRCLECKGACGWRIGTGKCPALNQNG